MSAVDFLEAVEKFWGWPIWNRHKKSESEFEMEKYEPLKEPLVVSDHIVRAFDNSESSDGMILDLGATLKEFRKATGMTQKEVGTKIGCHASTISTWETGDRIASIRLYDLLKLLKCYGLSAEEIAEIVREL